MFSVPEFTGPLTKGDTLLFQAIRRPGVIFHAIACYSKPFSVTWFHDSPCYSKLVSETWRFHVWCFLFDIPRYSKPLSDPWRFHVCRFLSDIPRYSMLFQAILRPLEAPCVLCCHATKPNAKKETVNRKVHI